MAHKTVVLGMRYRLFLNRSDRLHCLVTVTTFFWDRTRMSAVPQRVSHSCETM